MLLTNLIFAAAFLLLGAVVTGLLTWRGYTTLARAVVLALVLLAGWELWQSQRATEGMEDLGHLVTTMLMILPTLMGAALGLIIGRWAATGHWAGIGRR